MNRSIQQIVLSAEQIREMRERIEFLAAEHMEARARLDTAKDQESAARRTFQQEVNLAARFGITHPLYPVCE